MNDIIFRRINGRIIPVRKKPVTPHKGYAVAAAAANIASGLASGATLGLMRKHFLFGQASSVGLDLVSAGLNARAYKGRGRARDRVESFGRDQVRNTALGYGAMALAAAANPHARKIAVDWTKAAFKALKRVK